MTEELFHIGVKALVLREDSVLLIRSGSYWDLPGGRLAKGESLEAGLDRELQEEIGCGIDQGRELFATLLSNISIPLPDGRAVSLALVIYRGSLPEDVRPQAVEPGTELCWVTPREAETHLADKYPASFCRQVGQLTV